MSNPGGELMPNQTERELLTKIGKMCAEWMETGVERTPEIWALLSSPQPPAPSDDEVEALLSDLKRCGWIGSTAPEVARFLHAAGYRKAPTVDADLRERVRKVMWNFEATDFGDRAGYTQRDQWRLVDDLLALVASSSPVDRAAEVHAIHALHDRAIPESRSRAARAEIDGWRDLAIHALATVPPTKGETP